MCAYQFIDIFGPDKITDLSYVKDEHYYICYTKEKKKWEEDTILYKSKCEEKCHEF